MDRLQAKREAADDSPRVAHTLTACCRCRTRKTRCDPGLPRCGPCERTNSHCEYYDPTKGTRIPRNYVVHLQHKVRDLEKQLGELDKDDGEPDAEDVMRNAAAVHIQETNESKYLGASSGTPLTRLVMQLAKQFTDSKSISDIVPSAQQRMIKEQLAREAEKPTSKVYPLISNVAADELPTRELTNRLVQLFYLKVHPMYPIFHEPTFNRDVEEVYDGSTNPHKNFCMRMVIAISLQRMDTQYAGLADSYYLAALNYLEEAISPMNLNTLQCFTLIAGYSLLTPTRTAVYYQIGLAVRLTQALGLNEEKTLVRGRGGQMADPLQIDMRRRLFWCVLTMDYGLAHSLGRPAILATGREHIDVQFPALVDDQYITKDGIMPAPQTSLRKWIAIHFYKMRLLQLEIRRKLYQKKRNEPKDDSDPWFKMMEDKLTQWRDASPETDAGSGLTKTWFIGRFNTMRIFMFRPSPQVPRPSSRAALQCYDGCEYNIHLQRQQIATGSIDLTWIFTQSIFMAINTMLWSLSYSEVRRLHPRADVERHLSVALDAISQATSRWPGVASAIELYKHLTEACMHIYEKDGDVQITASSPSESSASVSRSRTTSPATASVSTAATVSTPPPPTSAPINNAYGFFTPQQPVPPPSLFTSAAEFPTTSPAAAPSTSPFLSDAQPTQSPTSFDPGTGFNPLPTSFTWNPHFAAQDAFMLPPVSEALGGATSFFPNQQNGYMGSGWDTQGMVDANGMPSAEYLYGYGSFGGGSGGSGSGGLTQEQQSELMEVLERSGSGVIDTMIMQSEKVLGRVGAR